jgi:hypothetical protein
VRKAALQRALSAGALVAALGVPLAASHVPASAASTAGQPATLSGQSGVAGLPIAKYWVSDGTVSKLQEAREELSLRCMAALGFKAVSAQYGEVSNQGASTLTLPVIERAASGLAQYAAGDSLGVSALVADSPVALVSRAPTAAEDAAMYGRGKTQAVTGGGGCWGQAGRTLYGSHPALPYDPRAAAVESEVYAAQAPATRAALARWAACMSRAGRHYATPLQAASAPQWNATGAGGSRASAALTAESGTAYADASCRSSSGLQKAMQSAEVSSQRAQLSQHLAAIKQSLRIVSGWLRNARAAEVSLAAPRPASTETSGPGATDRVSPDGVSGLDYFVGPVTYTNLSYNQRLDLWHDSTTSGNKVDIYPINGGNAQNWIYSNTLSNNCRVLAPNANENYAVQDPSGSKAYNEPASIWSYSIDDEDIDPWKTVTIPNAYGYPDTYYVIQNCVDWLYLNPYNGGNGKQLVWSVGGPENESDEVFY